MRVHLPTLVVPLPDILCYLPSTLEEPGQASRGTHTVTWQYRPQKQQWTEDKEWKESREDRCKVHDGEGMDEHKGKGGS